MKKELYEKVIETLAEALQIEGWRSENMDKKITELNRNIGYLQTENEALRAEIKRLSEERNENE